MNILNDRSYYETLVLKAKNGIRQEAIKHENGQQYMKADTIIQKTTVSWKRAVVRKTEKSLERAPHNKACINCYGYEINYTARENHAEKVFMV